MGTGRTGTVRCEEQKLNKHRGELRKELEKDYWESWNNGEKRQDGEDEKSSEREAGAGRNQLDYVIMTTGA